MRHDARQLMGAIAVGLITLLCAAAFAQEDAGGEKTLSPYFLVTSEDPQADQLPLKATSADVDIAGVIARVKVTQVYKNEGRHPLEAIYVFPGSTRAAVNAMKMTIGERTIVAKIEKREEARQQYEQAKQEGKSASLLEQQRPNVFQMNVANIMPGDEIKVEMEYSELLVPTEGVYEFMYPTVVGPRYSNQSAATAPATDKWVANPYTCEGEKPLYTFDIKVNLAAGMPIQDVTCNSHDVDISYKSREIAVVRLANGDKNAGNRDFILKYRLAGGKVETGLLLYKGADAKENFFLLMAQPPEKGQIKKIVPREYIFVVDVSGSMHGYPLEISKKLLRDLIGGLTTFDRFNVVLFESGNAVMAPASLPATEANIRQAIDVIDHQQGGGGTELLKGLGKALDLPRIEGFSRTVIIASDGYVSVEAQTFDLIRKRLGDANMFAFGIGTAVNRHLIEGIAHVGMGEPFVITKPEAAAAAAARFRTLVLTPVLTRVKVDFNGFDAYDVEPPSVPDVLAERPVVVFGKWRGAAAGRIRVSGIGADGSQHAQFINVADTQPSDGNAALRHLWARHRITLLADYNNLTPSDERVKEVTSLGLTYNLLTAYTSFIAVDSQVRNKGGAQTTVTQPLPLPEGVSNYAVGNGAGGGGSGYGSGYGSAGGMGRVTYKSSAKMSAPTVIHSVSASSAGETVSLGGMGIIGAGDADGTKQDKGGGAVTGSLDSSAVRQILQKGKKELQRVYERLLKSIPGLAGKIVVRVLIGADGSILKAEVTKDTVGNAKLKEAVVKAVKAMKFPAPSGGGGVIVTYPFEFKPSE